MSTKWHKNEVTLVLLVCSFYIICLSLFDYENASLTIAKKMLKLKKKIQIDTEEKKNSIISYI